MLHSGLREYVCLPDDLTTASVDECSDDMSEYVFMSICLVVLSATPCAGLPGVLPHFMP